MPLVRNREFKIIKKMIGSFVIHFASRNVFIHGFATVIISGKERLDQSICAAQGKSIFYAHRRDYRIS